MLEKAQTFPLNVNRLATLGRKEAWMTTEIKPCPNMEQKRVCYPELELWCPQDGTRNLTGEPEATLKELKGKDGLLGSKPELQEKWSIKFEGAYRRIKGRDTAAVPTIMAVAWNENGRDYSTEDEDLWVQVCKDVVVFLRNNNASYFGVEIIHWDMLDYQVVT
ncbi:uncharacterized protein F4822DRAFT_400141 [Hypoxylon trugodes]|uniref:uncharacterized protein n=1 Tax=Hypoxylon trugodes TaxID=326681 RepID=UPI0021920CC0|nr:uncharacterized protein F4822DRAFT_400141 [Hypoxylon trugodes]KAI1389898.1 hypothetical protein F4822DRAFT_400141 [Hypoxylon trugodes]